MTKTKCTFVTIIGAPNAGKSTLLNQLIGSKISIVSPKEQTTRQCIRGISIHDNTQIVYVDTPGIFKPKRKLEKTIVKAAWGGVKGADFSLFILDARKNGSRQNDSSKNITTETTHILEGMTQRVSRNILVLNKVDLISKNKLLPLIEKINKLADFEEIFLVSALTGEGVSDLIQYLVDNAAEDIWAYPEDTITDTSSQILASEITREKLMLQLDNELPYNMMVETEKWEEKNTKTGPEITINQVIYTISDSHKKIIVGKHGANIKEIGLKSRKELEKIFDCKIHLFLFVKIKENWIDKLQ